MPPAVTVGMNRSLEFAAFGGRVVYVGITQGNAFVSSPLLHRRELAISCESGNALSRDFDRIIKEIEAERINTRTVDNPSADLD